MIGTLNLTGLVKDIDPLGFALVAGITFAVDPIKLPARNQVVKIEAFLAQVPAGKDETPVWTVTSLLAFDPAVTANANRPVEVPHQTAHHTSTVTPLRPAGAALTPGRAKPDTPPTSTPTTVQPPAAAKANLESPNAPRPSVGRFGAVTDTTSRPAQAHGHQNASAPLAGRFGSMATARPAAGAAPRTAAQASGRPAFNPAAFEDSDVSF